MVSVREPAAVHDTARGHARAVARGAEERVRRGVYVAAPDWDGASDDARHLTRVLAVQATRRTAEVVFSHESAALLWGLPRLGRWPDSVHVLSRSRRGAVRGSGIVWHRDAFDDADVCERDGLLVTTLLRTLLDLARTRRFADAVMALDRGTKERYELADGTRVDGVEPDAVSARLRALDRARGASAARGAMRFSDNRSGSPGESLSRVQIHLLRFPRPRLQVPVLRGDGSGYDIPDFEWDDQLGEFDGKVKYTRDRYTRGLPIEEVVWQEKVREDRLRRATRKSVTRWLWNDAVHAPRLRRILIEAGLEPLSEGRYRREYGDVA